MELSSTADTDAAMIFIVAMLVNSCWSVLMFLLVETPNYTRAIAAQMKRFGHPDENELQ